MRRVVCFIILINIFLTVGVACTRKKNEFDFAAFWEKVEQELILQGKMSSMKELTQSEIDSLYEIDPDLIKEAIFRTANSPEIDASEIVLIETTSSSSLALVQQAIGTYQQKKYTQWENGIEEQFDYVKDYRTVAEGNYFLYVVSPAADSIIEIFKSFFD